MLAKLISCRFLFKVMMASLSFSFIAVSVFARNTFDMLYYHIDDDTREQEALLVFVRAFLCIISAAYSTLIDCTYQHTILLRS